MIQAKIRGGSLPLGGRSETTGVGFVKEVGFKPGVKESTDVQSGESEKEEVSIDVITGHTQVYSGLSNKTRLLLSSCYFQSTSDPYHFMHVVNCTSLKMCKGGEQLFSRQLRKPAYTY